MVGWHGGMLIPKVMDDTSRNHIEHIEHIEYIEHLNVCKCRALTLVIRASIPLRYVSMFLPVSVTVAVVLSLACIPKCFVSS